MDTQEAPKPPVAGVIYGKICYWIVMLGILVAVIGMIMYFASDGHMDKAQFLDLLWDGEEAEVIWETATIDGEVPGGALVLERAVPWRCHCDAGHSHHLPCCGDRHLGSAGGVSA